MSPVSLFLVFFLNCIKAQVLQTQTVTVVYQYQNANHQPQFFANQISYSNSVNSHDGEFLMSINKCSKLYIQHTVCHYMS